MIYAYEDKYDPQLKGLLKVGYTTVGVQQRVRQQYNIVRPGEPPYRILVEESAMRQDGATFMDHEVHRQLSKMGCRHVEGEWFRCTPQQVKAAIVAVRERKDSAWTRDKTFGMRPEQQAAVDKTAAYFDSNRREGGRVPHFLWNCKMRFGKTFTTYQLARRMGWRRVLVLTFKPAVPQWRPVLKYEPHALVLAQRCIVLCHEQSVVRVPEYFLPRLPCSGLCRFAGWYRAAGIATRRACHVASRPTALQDHHSDLRQADHRSDGQAVDGHFHASRHILARNLFPSGFPRAVALDHYQQRRVASQSYGDY